MSLITDTCLPLTIIILLIYIPESALSQLIFNITTSGRVGAPATLYCSSQEPDQIMANFLHNNGTINIFTSPTGEQQNSNGTSLIKSGALTIYIYKIPALSCSDRGEYTCRVIFTSAGLNIPRVSESLEVLGLAATPVLTAPNGSLILGDNATVSCQANVGNPAQQLKLCVGGDGGICATPDTAVKQEDRCIFTQSAQLTFQVTKTTKEATCSVGASTLNTRKNWTVDFPIESIMTLPRVDKVTLVRGTNKRYECHALGSPVPKYMWEFFPQSSADSRIYNTKEIQLDSTQSGVYVCTASNEVGGVSYNMTRRVVVTVVEPPTLPPTPPPTSPPTSPPSSGPSKNPRASSANTSDDKQNIIIAIVVPLVIIIIIIIIAVILYKRRRKPAEIEEPPEKPRNNHKEVNLKSPKPDLVETTGIDKKVPMYNVGFESGGEDDFGYNIDDKPRSRKPVFIANPNTFGNNLPCV